MSMNTWQPTGFSAGEFARMQQDAERRVEEMRRRARQSTGEPEHTYSAPVQAIQPGRGSPCLWRRHWPGFCGSGVCGFNIAYRWGSDKSSQGLCCPGQL